MPHGNGQRRLAEAVTRSDGFGWHADGGELLLERFDVGRVDGFGAVQEDAHGREVDAVELLGMHLAYAQAVGELRRDADRTLVLADHAQPEVRASQEVLRRD